MRRRTRPRVVWLPQTNAFSLGTGTQVFQAGLQANGGQTGASTSIEFPLVADAQLDILQSADVSIADVESSGYRLRRIVGKIWCRVVQVAQNTPISVIATAGIIVRRADTDTGQSLAGLAGVNNIDGGLIQNTGDPWVWRRSWWLGNNIATVPPSTGTFPTANYGLQYSGGIAEGPHVDQKTARVVGNEERLFLDTTLTIVDEDPAADTNLQVQWVTDLRILGSLRTATGNRSNSSR